MMHELPQKNIVYELTPPPPRGADLGRTLKDGMSGASVIFMPESGLVIKKNTEHPDKVRSEALGYARLKSTALRGLLPHLEYVPEENTIYMEYVQGTQLRRGLKEGTISQEAATAIIQHILTVKKNMWGSQTKHPVNGELRSMQREEWQDTLTRIHANLPSMAAVLGITPDDLYTKPFVIYDKELPSLRNLVHTTHAMLSEKPAYVVETHGDVTGANIIVSPDMSSVKIIDYEWAGYADPAEAMVRMTKYNSTTTFKEEPRFKTLSNNGALHIEQTVDACSPIATSIHEAGWRMVGEMGDHLQDDSFASRCDQYMAGSYLREVALCDKRGGPNYGLAALVLAGEHATSLHEK